MGGVIALSLAMALELAPVVRVTAISPGYVFNPMQRAEYTDQMLDVVNRKIPLGRHAKPEEIGALFAFLASEDAAFATGQVYVMDGAETTAGLCGQWFHIQLDDLKRDTPFDGLELICLVENPHAASIQLLDQIHTIAVR